MSHVRTQIRAALKTAFEAVTDLAGRVVSDPAEIKEAIDAPWVELVLGIEQVVSKTMGTQADGRRYTRQLRVTAGIHVRGYAEAIDKHEEITAGLEAAAFSARKLGGLLLSPLTLESIQLSEPDRAGSLPKHYVLLSWSCSYSTTEANPSIALTH